MMRITNYNKTKNMDGLKMLPGSNYTLKEIGIY